MYILVICLVALMAIGILFLLLPITYSFKGTLNSDPSFTFAGKLWRLAGFQAQYANHILVPSFMVLGKSFTIKRSEKIKDDNGDQDKQDKQVRQKKHSRGTNWLKSVTLEQINATFSLGKDVITIISPKLLRIEGEVGFPEPHLTSYMVACLAQIQTKPNININIQAVWIEEYCDLEIEIVGKIFPFQLITRAIHYIFSRPIRKFWLGKLQPFFNRSGNS